MKTLVLGCWGQLGVLMREAIPGSVGYSRMMCDVIDEKNVREVVVGERPDWIVYAAAYHRFDECEQNPDRAMAVNAYGADHVARAAWKWGARVVYFSTDYVFDGKKVTPYVESDPVNPINVYGKTKLLGEQAVIDRCPGSLVVRTASLFGPTLSRKGKSFVDRVLDREIDHAPTDQRMSPTYTPDLVKTTVEMMRRGENGVYHVVNQGDASWYELALQTELLDASSPPGSVIAPFVALSTNRPTYSVLGTERLLDKMPHWTDGVTRHVAWRQKVVG